MTDLHRILSDLSRQMVAEGYPIYFAMKAEVLILNYIAEHGPAAKAEADAERALRDGWSEASERQGVHYTTIYRRTKRFLRKSREVAHR
jgi:hypothetical protein